MVTFALRFGIKEWDEAVSAISTQDDRSTAIVLSSMLEESILQAIKCRFLQSDPAIEGQFMKGYGPLATFRSRIDLGFFMGFYTKECHTRLLKIKDIRNRMAHRIKPHNFETQEVKDLISFLPSPNELSECWAASKVLKFDDNPIIENISMELAKYPFTCRGIFLCYMQHRILSLIPFQVDKTTVVSARFFTHP